MTAVAHPAADEYAPAFAGYVSRVADLGDALDALTSQAQRVLQSLGVLGQ